jgi:hypothetical protein
MRDPFADGAAVETGPRAPGKKGEQRGLEIALPVDDEVVFARADLPDRPGDRAVRLGARERAAPFAVVGGDDILHRRMPQRDLLEILIHDPVELDPGSCILRVAQSGQRVDQIAQRCQLNEQDSLHLSSRTGLSGTR